jgi:hypothetical protein
MRPPATDRLRRSQEPREGRAAAGALHARLHRVEQVDHPRALAGPHDVECDAAQAAVRQQGAGQLGVVDGQDALAVPGGSRAELDLADGEASQLEPHIALHTSRESPVGNG